MVCIRGDTGEALGTKYWGHDYMMDILWALNGCMTRGMGRRFSD
jgi:hypothetical protein